MRTNTFKTILVKTGFVASLLLLTAGASFAQSVVTLIAKPTSTTLPDGQSVPMWGYFCDSPGPGVTCTATNGTAQSGTTWQPPLITVPSGSSLTITLNNNLSFPEVAFPGPSTNNLPTSLVIVGQLGGGLGTDPRALATLRATASPIHGPQGTTWAGSLPGGTADPACTANPADTATFCPPAQTTRVRSFGTEVMGGSGADLVWTAANLRPGTYLIHSGTQPSIQHPMGLYGVLVVTEPDATLPPSPQAYGQRFDSAVALLLSEIDPVQNVAVDTAVRTVGFTDTAAWSGQTGQCGDPTVHTCFPPAVNYSPLYYLINGVSFDRSNSGASALAVPAAAAQGNVMLRFVNAGLRMHVPSVVGANMSLIAEDGNKLPGVPKVQNSVFLAAGKTYDVTIQPTQVSPATDPVTYAPATYAVFDRQLSLSTNNQRDGGMQTYVNVNGGAAPASTIVTANGETYYCVAGTTLNVSDPSKGVLANDIGAYGATVGTNTLLGGASPLLTLLPNGTFTYAQLTGEITCGGTFNYMVNGVVPATATIVQCDVTTPGCAQLSGAPSANPDTYTSNIGSRLQIPPPGVLANDTDPLGLPLKATGLTSVAGGTVTLNPDGSFVALPSCSPACPVGPVAPVTFQYSAINSQNSTSPLTTVTVNFGAPSGLVVRVKDGKSGNTLPNDYRWIIEEDRTVGVNPATESAPSTSVRNAAINFHTSHMPVVAQGCVGTVSCEAGQTLLGVEAVCDVGNGTCRTDATHKVAVRPSQVSLDPAKRYYISILPGDAWITGEGDCDKNVGGPNCGHTMGGAQIAAGQTSVDVFLQTTPLQTAKISVFVFQDDAPLNGEVDTGGGVDVLAPNEPGLGGFNIVILDQAGTLGDSTGQATYDMFNEPLSNALAGTIDPATGRDACPISPTSTDGMVGMIVTCPKYEGPLPTDTPTTPKVLSPLAGHALVANLYPGLYEVQANAGADRIARGEEWLQTSTLDGTKAIEAFIKAGEPGYFQEFGPGGFHVAVGFANPAIINNRKGASGDGLGKICSTPGSCPSNFYGQVTSMRMSRTPDQRVYSSGDYTAYSFTQCYVSLGAPDGDDFAFTKCDADGKFEFNGLPATNLRITVFDQWNDLIVDGLSTPIKTGTGAAGSTPGTRMEIAATQWRTNLYGRIFLDQNNDGVSQDDEPGLPLVPYNLRYRDGSYAGFNNTDLAGGAGFNEVFPFLNWIVVDTDSARYKLTGVHVVYDAGGQVDGKPGGGTSTIAAGFANTIESASAHVPSILRVPGAKYCLDGDCSSPGNFTDTMADTLGAPGSTGRVDPGWAATQGWQGLLGQNSFINFAMRPFVPGENGGIKGHVLYTPTRPFDDPQLLLQLSWAPAVPNVTVNLYQEITAPDGTKTMKLVDTTTSSSWDDWAQGFRTDADGNLINVGTLAQPRYIPNMSCPGQETNSPFYFTMQGGTQYLNPDKPMAADGRFKCYDGWSMMNQVQPAPYNGMYKFPSIVAKASPSGSLPLATDTPVLQMDPKNFKTNCTICVPNPDASDPLRFGTPMLPAGKYVVEVVVPQGYELVKEEDRNILMGDAFIGPAVSQFVGFGNIYIMPDQAAVNSAYNPYNTLQRTRDNGAVPRREGDTGSAEVFWPCVGAMRVVPDLASLFPAAGQMAAFAGATRPLCDRKEVILSDEMTVLAKFYLFSSTHIAGHYTGAVTNDFASEFDPFSPQFGEKFAMPNVPVAMKDFAGKEISRVYTDQWGIYNGLNFSTWTVWPPSPSGYVPQMMIACMNDPGPIVDTTVGSPTLGQMITDPHYNPAYSNFCYEIPFMPGQTAYLDTPVIPTMAHAAGYNLPDCEYPDFTPAIKSAEGTLIPASTGKGPWVNAAASVASVTVNTRGSGYTSAPAATLTPVDAYGSGATAAVTMRVNTITVNSPGSGYTSNDLNNATAGSGVTIAAPGVGTTATVVAGGISLKVVGFRITSPGTCTAGAHGVTFTGGGPGVGSPNHAAATATFTNPGGVTALTITDDGGNYTGVPTVQVANCSETVLAVMGVRAITVSVVGSGYTTQPAVTIVAPPAGCLITFGGTCTTASASAFLSVDAVAVTAAGSGYDAPPSVSFASGTATATAVLGPLTATDSLVITALGDKTVLNHAYSGPMSTLAPYNKKFITRHYGFGATTGSVTIAGVNAPVTSWSDTSITVTVPSLTPAQSTCTIQQRNVTATTLCGELVITAANGKQSVDAVTVTIGGKPPVYVTPASPSVSTFGHIQPSPLQTAIDSAVPGDLIIVGPGTYKETLLMWKPVRLQGVAAESVIINADAHPSEKMEAWRRQVNCLFGLALNGQPNSDSNPFDASSSYSCPDSMRQQVDRIPFEGILGWDTTVNGNLAQMLQEPTLMGAYEGAGITVLGKGIAIPADSTDFYGAANAGGFPAGYAYLTNSNTFCNSAGNPDFGRDYGTSNFLCNPSRIDGVSIINSSQGGGAIFAHGWNHNLEIANTRVHGNHGTLTGGIVIGNGEFPDPFICDAAAVDGTSPLPAGLPGTCNNANLNVQLGYGFNRNTNVHHNAVTSNASIGDALYSGTPSAAGGVSVCTGADGYKLTSNWVCGNLSTGDSGGVAHLGFINDGTIAHNKILFNQSANPTIPTHGGGLAILGASPDRTLADGTECGATSDQDCPPGLAEGTGRNLLIDSNLIMGNSAESGSGGGLRLQMVNGLEVIAFPTTPTRWNDVRVINNIITNNVAGWDGGGVSMQDALRVRFVNNTVMQNDTTASAGVLFNTLGAPTSATPPPGCTPTTDPTQPQNPNCSNPVTTSTFQAAGFVTMAHTPNLVAALPGTVTCPTSGGNGSYPYSAANNGNCRSVSLPILANNIFWQNRAFHVAVTEPTNTGLLGQTSVVTLVPTLHQNFTGQLVTQGTNVGAPGSNDTAHFWDIGVRGDTSPTPNSGSGFALTPINSILTSTTGYSGTNNAGNPAVLRQYANGARIPPENCGGVDAIDNPRCKGYNAPPGRSEFTGLPPVFALNQVTVAATVDEGNNWINLGYGPLSLISPVDGQTVLGNYAISDGSPAINLGSTAAALGAPTIDFFGRPRTLNPDAGAVEYIAATGAAASVAPSGLDFGDVLQGTNSPTQTLTLHNNGTVALTGISWTITAPFSRTGGTCVLAGGLAVNSTCTIILQFAAPLLPPLTQTALSIGTASISTTETGAVTGSPVTLDGTSATAPIMSVTPGPLAFGTVAVGPASTAQTLTVTNTGGSPFTFTAITFSNPRFSRPAGVAGGTCGANLPGGDGVLTGVCTINVVFTPIAVGAQSGTVAITGTPGTVANSPVSMSGTGAFISDLAITKIVGNNNVWRGNVVTYSVVVTNNGPSPATGVSVSDSRPTLNISSWTWSCAPVASCGGSAASNTGQTGNIAKTAVSLASGASITFTINATISATSPAGSFNNTATVTAAGGVTDSPTTNNTATVAVTVGAVAFTSESGIATLNLGTGTLAFGNLAGAQTDTVTITVNAPVTFGTATVSNNTGIEFTKGADTCSGNSFIATQTCTIVVNFAAPLNNSGQTGTLSAPHSGAGSPAELNLTGS